MRRQYARRRPPIVRLRRGVYLLPSLLTTGNIFCGFTSIVMTFNRDFRTAAILIIAAGVLDGLDGRIARLTGGTSEFGGEYDSLADVVSFGLAPSFLASVWGLFSLRRYGWVIAFLFLACGAIRLARFNIQHGASDRRWFVGLPIPMAATAVAGCTLYFENPIRDPVFAGLYAFLTLGLSFLMVSRVRYRSFKDIDLRSRRSFRTIVPIAIVLAAIAIEPALAVLVIAAVYLLSGPLLHVAYLRSLQQSQTPVGAAAAAPGAPALSGAGLPSGAHGEKVSEVPLRES